MHEGAPNILSKDEEYNITFSMKAKAARYRESDREKEGVTNWESKREKDREKVRDMVPLCKGE